MLQTQTSSGVTAEKLRIIMERLDAIEKKVDLLLTEKKKTQKKSEGE